MPGPRIEHLRRPHARRAAHGGKSRQSFRKEQPLLAGQLASERMRHHRHAPPRQGGNAAQPVVMRMGGDRPGDRQTQFPVDPVEKLPGQRLAPGGIHEQQPVPLPHDQPVRRKARAVCEHVPRSVKPDSRAQQGDLEVGRDLPGLQGRRRSRGWSRGVASGEQAERQEEGGWAHAVSDGRAVQWEGYAECRLTTRVHGTRA